MRTLLAFLSILAVTPALAEDVENPRVRFATDLGAIDVEIFVEEAPVTAANFLRYVDEDRFRVASFYRVVTMDNQEGRDVKIEVIQGGVPEGSERLEAIEHETTETTGILHLDGTISMARLDPGTATCEFFFCVGDQPELDFGGARNPDGQGFAAFGRVMDGLDVVRAIQELPEENQRLTEPVVIRSIRRVESGADPPAPDVPAD